MLSSQVKFSADRWTPVKQNAPNLLMLGHKNSGTSCVCETNVPVMAIFEKCDLHI